MKRSLSLALLLLLALPCASRAASIGVGVFGGETWPVLQDDAGKGTLVGVRAPIKLVPFFRVEPYYASTSLADKVTNVAGVTYTRQGFDEKTYGVNAMLAAGGPVSFYPYAGVGRTSLSRSSFDKTLTTYNLGAGFGFSAVPKLSVDVRGELQAVVDGQTTRKFANATAGLSYSLFSLP
jgi:hypothetical protein